VQASLSEDPSLQVQSSEVDLPVEHLRRGERSHLLPLISERPSPTWGPATRHCALTARNRLGAMLD